MCELESKIVGSRKQKDIPVDVDIEATRQVARVKAVVDDSRTIYLELRNGQYVNGTSDTKIDIAPGTVVLVGDNRLTTVPPDLWPDETMVGVVRLKNKKHTVIDASGRLHRLPTSSDVEYEPGNTVLATDHGVLEKVANEPIRSLESVIDDGFISNFIIKPGLEPETFDDFGGDPAIAKRALELIETPLTYHKELAEIGARPIKGVLFSGHPGTGKTMLARIIAAHAKAVFYKVSGPEVVSKWVGQSEEILRKIFEHAAGQERAIIFFDEIDSVAIKRSGDVHEASRRLVAQFLTSLDGFEPKDNVVVIATTNRRDDIDPALLRPGRFDWEIKFSLPDAANRESILKRSSRKLKVKEPLSHARVAKQTDGWSGADLTAIWSEAAILAVTDGRRQINDEDYLGGLQRVIKQRLNSAPKESDGTGAA